MIISTHSPRVGRTARTSSGGTAIVISTHSPRVGRTEQRDRLNAQLIKFQLTRPVWGEPIHFWFLTKNQRFQLTRPVWGEPDCNSSFAVLIADFNSLAPCGANQRQDRRDRGHDEFQLTRPVWGEPRLRRRRDLCDDDFNSLAPCGANPYIRCTS